MPNGLEFDHRILIHPSYSFIVILNPLFYASSGHTVPCHEAGRFFSLIIISFSPGFENSIYHRPAFYISFLTELLQIGRNQELDSPLCTRPEFDGRLGEEVA